MTKKEQREKIVTLIDRLQLHKPPIPDALPLNVLPVRVPMCVNECSRPTSKETDTLHGSKLSPQMIQILKFTYHLERLDFNNGWVSKEAEL